MIPEKRKHDDLREQPCPVCNGTSFEWGVLDRTGYSKGVMSWRMSQLISLRRCLDCDNVLMFMADPEMRQAQKMAAIKLVVIILLVVFSILAITMLIAYQAQSIS